MTHAALPLLVAAGLGRRRVPGRLMVAGAFAAMLPDMDVIAFWAGVPYESMVGHRGFTHSLSLALIFGLLAAFLSSSLGAPRWIAFLFVGCAMASHGLADMLTDGGHGIAILWPFEETRHFASWRPIEVSPIGIERFVERGPWRVLESELIALVLPVALLSLSLRLVLPLPVDFVGTRS